MFAWALVAGALPAAAGGSDNTPCTAVVCRVLFVHVVPATTPGLLALEQTFTEALASLTPGTFAFNSEYVDPTAFDPTQVFEAELVAYLAAKYGRTRLDLVVVTGTESLRFVAHHRARLFPGVPIVFLSVLPRLVTDVPLDQDMSGVWMPTNWLGTLAAARKLDPALERVVVVSGAGPIDLLQAKDARLQLESAGPPLPVTYLHSMTLEGVLSHVATLPPRTAVLLGTFFRDAAGRRFSAAESASRISAASSVPVYGTLESQFGHGVVGGELVSFAMQGRQAAEVAGQMLRGQRAPPRMSASLAYRFDARQLDRWKLDKRRVPEGSAVEFGTPSIWQTHGEYIASGVVLFGLQSWLIAVLLLNRAKRRRAQETVAAELRFETLISDILAGQLTRHAGANTAGIEDALARIGDHLDVDRVTLAERDVEQERVQLVHVWMRPGIPDIPRSLEWGAFPWMAAELAAGRPVRVSPQRPLPGDADTDRHGMLAYGTRSMLAVPLIVAHDVVGVLSCAAVRQEREWSDALLDRLRLLADVFASQLARHRAEIAARETQARYERQRQELAHALRVNTLGELGASLAHEINQPLAAILLNARTLGEWLADEVNASTAIGEALKDVAADAKRAAEIISRLRALSRNDQVVKCGLDLDALIDDVVALLHQDFVRRGIAVRRVRASDGRSVKGDRIQLQQVFLNLLVNASEALEKNPHGEGEITVITSRPVPGLIEVAVRDNGMGAAGVDTERMFQRFVTTKPNGLGMGLAISQSIAASHHGRIYAKVNPDQGLTVHVELPADT